MYAGVIDLSDQPLLRGASALALVVVAWLFGRVLQSVLTPRLSESRTPSFGRVVPKLIAWGITIVATIVAITICFPSVKPVDVIGGLGIFSIAIGFAFQDILSNLLAGLLLILRQPFESGDQIDVNGMTGTVEGITVRETTLKTFDGQRVVIPNKDVYQSAIVVRTAFEARRTSLVVGVGYGDDLDEAADVLRTAIGSVDGVVGDPEPEIYLVGLGDSSVDFDLRYWTAPDQATVRRVQHEVLRRVKVGLDDAGIDMPFPVRTLEIGASVGALRDALGAGHASDALELTPG